jgi:nucleoside-diphosphate-sugar epimerase
MTANRTEVCLESLGENQEKTPMPYSLQGKTVLVTGGTGFIGRPLTAKLLSLGASVRVMIRNRNDAHTLAPGIDPVIGDLTDAESLRQAVRGCQAVVHLAAALGDRFEPRAHFRQVNIEGTRSLAEAALSCGVERFIHISSVWAYGLVPCEGIDETFPLKASNTPYGDTKAEGQKVVERLSMERALPSVIVQPGDVYGPADQKWTVGPMTLMLSGNFKLIDQGKGIFQPIFVDDLVEGIVLAAEKGRIGESYILCGAERTTFHEYFRQLAVIAGVQKLPSVPYWLAMTMATLAESFARLTGGTPPFTRTGVRGTYRQDSYSMLKAKQQLGFQPRTSLAEGLKRIEAWSTRAPGAPVS